MDRIALYSHDAFGLGHLRRNLALARAIARPAHRSVLVITGVREAAGYPLPEGVDILTVPAVTKDQASSAYRPRRLRTSSRRLAGLRADIMRAALESFAPDALIVDKHPLGLERELEPALYTLHQRGTKLVLGLRDVLDDPVVAQAEWRAVEGEEAVRALYSDVWVYGDPRVYDVVREVDLGDEVAAKAHYTGYLSPRRGHARPAAAVEEADLPVGPFVVCLVGGGEDGLPLADAFARAPLPAGTHGVLLTGPFMSDADRRRLQAAAHDRLRVLDFLADPAPLIERADSIVTMGGYNTLCEVLAYDRPALVVPRVAPRREQLIRARRLAERGIVDVVLPGDADPGRLGAWLAADRRYHRRAEDLVDLHGLDRVPRLLERLVDDPSATEGVIHAA